MSLLREVLREHDHLPPANPVRQAQVSARIRRIRLRRRLVATGAALATAAAVFAVVSIDAPAPQETKVALQPAADLPEHFTAQDGTEYTRLAKATISHEGKNKKVTLTVPVSGKSIDVAASCDQGKSAGLSPITYVDGKASMEAMFGVCEPEMKLRPVPIPAGVSEVAITFDLTQRSSGKACVTKNGTMVCEAVKNTPDRSVWNLAVYEWADPATTTLSDAPKPFPAKVEQQRLLQTKSGTWPQDTEVTFKVTGHGRKMGLDQICTGALAARLHFTLLVNGKKTGQTGTCGLWATGPYPMAISQFPAPDGKPVTVTLKWDMPGAPSGRAVRWSVGLFERMK